MDKWAAAILFGLLTGASGMVALAAPDAVTEKAAGVKETPIELLIRVTVANHRSRFTTRRSRSSGLMEERLESERTNQKGEARFRDLAKGEVTIMVIARDWKTFKAARPIAKSHETVDVLLQPLD